uniref:myosin-10-like n=1 Tax=Doryrhamphus excisus TaxID=161450 RepID=UPI0025AE449C|nr:myosin-10-like [Doryrhamphus excisus]
MGAFHGRCGQLEEELRVCGQRCRELEENISAVSVDENVLQQQQQEEEEVVDSVKTDHSRLIRDLKEQATQVDCLQEALKREQTQVLQLQEEVVRLSQEKHVYSRMAEQLSTQIVQMEEEMSALQSLTSRVQSDLLPDRQDDLKSSVVEQLSEQLESKTGELVLVRGQNLQLQLAVLDSQTQLRTAEDAFEQEKKKMRQQLTEMEHLVLVLEQVMDPASPQRFVEHETAAPRSASNPPRAAEMLR